ncbi:nucleotide pyrophosphohydrolase [Carnobacterium maltaromaticum]|uniref:nucleotide pyrophosphohydrolase n=1 Tax=Carnobacterium maltaromaticum TaxID=2751 RepID=UPI000C772B36|nr:nucleotide pyrophosphohydrolase [Carnobacterium maltaromaticum]PLS39418.1 nucleotide pyrophosphohydrolase [Carnobacterium maltaromaticum]PLS40226.1 nucleotide pyrophosphohydrolase [Carnobacterium maltaromaticum]PLS40564.1 nucleotide pyrophosphohydrolase [Carnobacterium maltaromaticum]PLS46207.1 nucleotide pyrophosphohydrolase [Carnobacterium maltaromaticum]PLS47356.1 nucleotide pyrophosphohydrolase [Carnobacterium maltaromaticum]
MDDLIKEINQFRDDRDWRQFHNAKDLALSVSLEASELLENFQWKSSEESIADDLENIKDEIADVMIYSLMLADDLGLSVEEIIKNKIKKNGEKYTIEKSKGKKEKYKSQL